MDQHAIAEAPTRAERAAVDAELGPPRSRWEGGERAERSQEGDDARTSRTGWSWVAEQRHRLLPTLWAVQEAVGYVSPGALGYLCQRLGVPPAEGYGVATFYALLATEPAPPVVVHVCDDIACRTAGAEQLCQRLAAEDATAPFSEGAAWHRSPCLGQCERGPAALVQRAGGGSGARGGSEELTAVTADQLLQLLRAAARGPAASPASSSAPPTSLAAERLQLLARVPSAADGSRHATPADAGATTLTAYRAAGGYQALPRAMELGSEAVCAAVDEARLVGRGGAAFPTGTKWQAVAAASVRPHYVVCNADESEPGTFKDRIVLEADPFAVVEALTIAALATGSERGFVYIRGEYPLAEARLRAAIDECYDAGLLGAWVDGSELAFELEIRRGAGAYICGEETALFNSIEGYRGEPRNKPPFPTERGLFGMPTAVNNVETLVNVLPILRAGAAAYAGLGTEGSTGTKLLCLSGCIARPGLYEVAFGATLGQLIERAGGVRNGHQLRAVLLGGAAGSFVGPEQLDLPLTFEGCREAGTSLGSGVVMVFDDTVDMADIVARVARFFRDESCGQCVPCRVGTIRVVEAVSRLAAASGDGAARDGRLIDEIAQAMRDASICGLGHTAANAVQSALALGLLE